MKGKSDFFDSAVENSLTLTQRRTIIIDEANNLAVAGAGTGKTLTLVGKVGYILEKGLAQPDEVLLLAFAKKVKREMEERVKADFGVNLNIRTFHSFGREVIGESSGEMPRLTELSSDQILFKKTVEEFLQKRMKDMEFLNLLNRYFVYYLNPVENILDFSTQEEYEEYLQSIQIRSLKGDLVKSYAECEIANFLYLNQVSYEYEKEYPVKTASESRRQYTPDFYLPEQNIWIEHIGIDRKCGTAPGVDRWNYLDEWYWKRKRDG